MNIAIIGEAGSGKDVAGEILIRKYGYYRYAFADEVKALVSKYFPHLYDGKLKNRNLLQLVGTDMFRSIDPDVWVRAMFNIIDIKSNILKGYGLASEHIVVTDCRFPNEYEALKDRGFTFIRINVDENIRKQRMVDRGDVFEDEDMKHRSESYYDLFECEYEIENNGTLEEFKVQLDNVMDRIIRKE